MHLFWLSAGAWARGVIIQSNGKEGFQSPSCDGYRTVRDKSGGLFELKVHQRMQNKVRTIFDRKNYGGGGEIGQLD